MMHAFYLLSLAGIVELVHGQELKELLHQPTHTRQALLRTESRFRASVS